MGTTEPRTPRDASHWAQPVSSIHVAEPRDGLANLVEGKRLLGPVQGFGQMWQKTFHVRLDGAAADPQHVIAEWKAHFPRFWPEGNRFAGPLTGIAPGEVALIRGVGPGGLRLSTGVFVLYADDVSFTLMTPQGHLFAGWVTLSAHEEDGVTVAQAQVLMRGQDPLCEIGLVFGGHRVENRFWEETLRRLAAHFGVEGRVETAAVCVDRRRQWRAARNIRHQVVVRSALYAASAPLRALGSRRARA